MTERYEDLGGRTTSSPTPSPQARGCGHDCQWPPHQHPDRHICPWRDNGATGITHCGCTHQPQNKGR